MCSAITTCFENLRRILAYNTYGGLRGLTLSENELRNELVALISVINHLERNLWIKIKVSR